MADTYQPASIHLDRWLERGERVAPPLVGRYRTFTKLNKDLWPGRYCTRSSACDVARVKARCWRFDSISSHHPITHS